MRKRLTDAKEDTGPSSWWVCTDWLKDGGRKVIGPFDSRALALDVRTYVEKAEGHNRYFVDEQR